MSHVGLLPSIYWSVAHLFGGVVGARAEEKQHVDPDGDGGVNIDIHRDVEDVRDLGSAAKTAGVMGVEQQSCHGRTDDAETFREGGYSATRNNETIPASRTSSILKSSYLEK